MIEARFSRLVDGGERPERVLVLAPSPGRADALRVRLEARLQQGYEALHVLTPVGLAAWVLGIAAGGETDLDATTLSAGDRLAMLIERIDELSVRHHDFGGRVNALFGAFVRRIDRCKTELIDAEAYAAWAARLGVAEGEAALEQEFAEVYRAHERMLADAGARDEGDLMRDGLRAATTIPRSAGVSPPCSSTTRRNWSSWRADWRARSPARRGRD